MSICKLFCGGKSCRHEDFSKLPGDQKLAIYGLHSQWVGENVIAMQRPSSRLMKEHRVVEQFKSHQIAAIVNLQEPGEHAYCGDGNHEDCGFSYRPEEFMDNGILFFNFAWKDMGVPTLDLVSNIVRVMEFVIRTKGKVAVHCHAGLGRTGLVIACYLIYAERMQADEAVAFVRHNRPGAIQNRSQMQFVRDFEQYVRDLRRVFHDVESPLDSPSGSLQTSPRKKIFTPRANVSRHRRTQSSTDETLGEISSRFEEGRGYDSDTEESPHEVGQQTSVYLREGMTRAILEAKEKLAKGGRTASTPQLETVPKKKGRERREREKERRERERERERGGGYTLRDLVQRQALYMHGSDLQRVRHVPRVVYELCRTVQCLANDAYHTVRRHDPHASSHSLSLSLPPTDYLDHFLSAASADLSPSDTHELRSLKRCINEDHWDPVHGCARPRAMMALLLEFLGALADPVLNEKWLGHVERHFATFPDWESATLSPSLLRCLECLSAPKMYTLHALLSTVRSISRGRTGNDLRDAVEALCHYILPPLRLESGERDAEREGERETVSERERQTSKKAAKASKKSKSPQPTKPGDDNPMQQTGPSTTTAQSLSHPNPPSSLSLSPSPSPPPPADVTYLQAQMRQVSNSMRNLLDPKKTPEPYSLPRPPRRSVYIAESPMSGIGNGGNSHSHSHNSSSSSSYSGAASASGTGGATTSTGTTSKKSPTVVTTTTTTTGGSASPVGGEAMSPLGGGLMSPSGGAGDAATVLTAIFDRAPEKERDSEGGREQQKSPTSMVNLSPLSASGEKLVISSSKSKPSKSRFKRSKKSEKADKSAADALSLSHTASIDSPRLPAGEKPGVSPDQLAQAVLVLTVYILRSADIDTINIWDRTHYPQGNTPASSRRSSIASSSMAAAGDPAAVGVVTGTVATANLSSGYSDSESSGVDSAPSAPLTPISAASAVEGSIGSDPRETEAEREREREREAEYYRSVPQRVKRYTRHKSVFQSSIPVGSALERLRKEFADSESSASPSSTTNPSATTPALSLSLSPPTATPPETGLDADGFEVDAFFSTPNSSATTNRRLSEPPAPQSPCNKSDTEGDGCNKSDTEGGECNKSDSESGECNKLDKEKEGDGKCEESGGEVEEAGVRFEGVADGESEGDEVDEVAAAAEREREREREMQRQLAKERVRERPMRLKETSRASSSALLTGALGTDSAGSSPRAISHSHSASRGSQTSLFRLRGRIAVSSASLTSVASPGDLRTTPTAESSSSSLASGDHFGDVSAAKKLDPGSVEREREREREKAREAEGEKAVSQQEALSPLSARVARPFVQQQ